MRREIGIMQGRLSPPEGGRIQFFPERTWRDEFAKARECGLDRIEWIIDEPRWRENPIMTDAGRAEIEQLSRDTGVSVRSACADVFMAYPLHSAAAGQQERREAMLREVIEAAGKAGLEHVDIPFVDASAIATEAAFDTVVRVFREAAGLAAGVRLTLCLETSLEPARFKRLLEAIAHPNVKANFDIGNSASLGYAPAQELAAIGPWLACVHIKDRRLAGSTVPLGTGGADFEAVSQGLAQARYGGHFVLQAARGSDEVEWTKRNVAFARRFIDGIEAANGSKA